MTLDEIRFIFNRALSASWKKIKLIITFIVLVFCGVLIVFFQGIALDTGRWIALSLAFLPIFLCAGILLSLGILLIRIYHDEVKGKNISYKRTLVKSWEVVIGASYFSVPMILCYLLLWMLLGMFVLLSEIPNIGDVFSAVLAFGPFLINLGTLLLTILNLALLFYVTPILALKGFNRIQVSRILANRFKNDVFSNLFLIVIGLLPLFILLALLTGAALLTGSLCSSCSTPVQTILMWFFTMIPFMGILSPAVIFFFNFAAEAHVLVLKQQARSLP
ncbi:MAG: hypothetical protein WB791_10480 [Waddliaceae bacterium]